MLFKKFQFSFINFVMSFLSAWLLFSGGIIAVNTDFSLLSVSIDNSSAVLFTGIIFVIGVALFFISSRFHKSNFSAYTFVFSLFVFSLILCVNLGKMNTYIVMFAVLLLALYCFNEKYKPKFLHRDTNKKFVLFTISAFGVFVLFCACLISILKYSTYSAPNYDFGIFCNMFYNMKKTGLPVTSCERDRLLSHFAVHISPVFYILLPVYYIFSSPVTLAVLQPLVIFSALIPAYLLAKQLKLSQNSTMYILIAIALFVPLSAGCFYDMHENCFLVPLLLWMFLFFEKDKKLLLGIFALLVLFVKEDAFIYVAFFSLYIIVSRKRFAQGISLLAFSVAYFLLAFWLLQKYGLGVMESRYGNLSQSGSLFDAAKTILFNPGYAVSQVLETKTDDLGKIYYIANLLCPLVFIPFMSKDFSRYILVLPIFINLLTKYPYQYNIVYQYSFGICAFLIYLTLLNLSDMKKEKQNSLSFAAILMSLIMFSMIVLPKTINYVIKYEKNKGIYSQITQALEIIPENAEVSSSTYILPHLANRDIIYEDEYHHTPSTEYFVLDLRQPVSEGRAKIYLEKGYELISEVPDVLEIYQLKE